MKDILLSAIGVGFGLTVALISLLYYPVVYGFAAYGFAKFMGWL